jgi:hypothetical protein
MLGSSSQVVGKRIIAINLLHRSAQNWPQTKVRLGGEIREKQ